jgi:riboflavin synthase
MFTGIVEELGAVAAISPTRSAPGADGSPVAAGGSGAGGSGAGGSGAGGSGAGGSGVIRMVFHARTVTEAARVGDSIAVNGCCLTVVDLGPGWFAADAVAETLGRSNLGQLSSGDPVNLERPVRVGGRLGGHLVQGHVDGVGRISRAAPELEVEAPESVLRYAVEKGSVTVDGVSLTVVAVTGGRLEVAVIPHTLAITTLGRKTTGDTVNLEADVIAKYTERLLRGGADSPYRGLALSGEPTRPTGPSAGSSERPLQCPPAT